LPFLWGTELEAAFFFIICNRLSAVFICELLDEDPEEPEPPRFITREAVVEAAKALALMGLGWLLLIVGAEEAALLGIVC